MNVVLGVKTWDRRMIGVDISTEFWRPRVDYVFRSKYRAQISE